MKVLVDTHIVLWATSAPERLGSARDVLEAADIVVSVVTAWEIVIKTMLDRLDLPDAPERFWAQTLQSLDARTVDVSASHVLAVTELPLHHHDPFDRLLIAQARTLRVPIVSADRAFMAYDVELIRPEA